jgi:cytoskeletal protein CcmA (bactofilin family)
LALKDSSLSTSSTEINLLGTGTVVEGTIRAESSVRVDGKITGKLICKNTLTIGANGDVEGEVQAKNAIVGGKINGKIRVAEKLVLESKSVLIGELKASKLIIEEGAVFEGTSNMGKKEQLIPKPVSEPLINENAKD